MKFWMNIEEFLHFSKIFGDWNDIIVNALKKKESLIHGQELMKLLVYEQKTFNSCTIVVKLDYYRRIKIYLSSFVFGSWI